VKESSKSEVKRISDNLVRISSEVAVCRRCPRLVGWREEAGRRPPKRFSGERYWARPLSAFGDPKARLLLVGLAPAAHGGNRTGRIFTGDRSGDFLFSALHAVGLANRPESVRAGDGLELTGALLTAACRCAPPANRPTPEEFDNCRPFLVRELALLPEGSAILALGALAFEAVLKALSQGGLLLPKPRPRFSHGCRVRIASFVIFGSYHPSQQNTFTGKLTQPMLRSVVRRALAATRVS